MGLLGRASGFMNTGGSSGISAADFQRMMRYGSNIPEPGVSSNIFDIGNSGVTLGQQTFSNNPVGDVAGSVADPSGWSWLDSINTKTGIKTQGVLGTGLGIAQGLGNTWMGMQNLKVAKDTLKANKEQFALNYGAQKQTTNTALEDRQRARVAANSTAYQSVGDYMNKNRIV